MKTYVMQFQHKSLRKITITSAAYDHGSISLVTSDPQYAQDLRKTLLKDISKKHIQLFGNMLIVSSTFFLRKIIKTLENHELLNNEEKSTIYSLLQEIEKINNQKSNLEWDINKPQNEVLASVSSVYVDDIIEQSDDYVMAVILLRSAFSYRLQEFLQPLQLFIKEKNMDSTLIDSIQDLWKMLHGLANMESTYLRLEKNHQLPELHLQRMMIYKQCIAKLKTKFSKLNNKSKFSMIFGLLMFVHLGQGVSPLSDISVAVVPILQMDPVSELAKKILNVDIKKPDISLFLDKVFSEMDMPKDYKGRMQLIESLQKEFKSPVLLSYLRGEEQIQKMIEADEKNLLLQGLKEKNIAKIREAMKNGADINQFFLCNGGRPPLLMAVQSHNLEILKLILSYKPDLNQWNQFRTVTPLHVALKNKNPSQVEMLLKAGVNVFEFCGIIERKENTSQNEPPKISWEKYKQFKSSFAKPLTVALKLYQEEKSPATKQNIQLLLKYGAGISHQFSVRCDELLENAVIPLSSYHVEGIKVNAIFNYEALLNRISFEDLPHWRDIFRKAKVYFTAKRNRSTDTTEIQFLNGFLLPTLSEFFIKIVTKLACKNVFNLFSNLQQSPISSERFFSLTSSLSDAFSFNLHDKVMRELLLVAPQKKQMFEPFFIAMAKKHYGKALRIACTVVDPDAFLLIKKLLKYKSHLKININEQAGEKQRAALHHAALKNNKQVYKFLIENGANPNLPDADGKSPSQYANETLENFYLGLLGYNQNESEPEPESEESSTLSKSGVMGIL